MYVFAYRNTERGIAARNVHIVQDERQQRLKRQQAVYAAQLAESERIERIRNEAAERARAYTAELRAAGHRYRPSYSEIERKACDVFGVTRTELHSNRREQRIVIVRQFISYWAVRLTPLSLPQIGRLLGGRDHTTILHNRRKYPERRAKMGRNLRPVS